MTPEYTDEEIDCITKGQFQSMDEYNRLVESTQDTTGKPHEVEVPHIVGSLPECRQCVVVRKGTGD